MFEIGLALLVVYLLLSRYLEIKLLMSIEQKLTQKEEKAERPKRVHANVAKTTYSTPLKTYKEYEQYKNTKTGLYEPRKPSRGLKIQGDDEE